MASLPDFQSGSAGSSPASLTKCHYHQPERCLYTEGRWWTICRLCSLTWREEGGKLIYLMGGWELGRFEVEAPDRSMDRMPPSEGRDPGSTPGQGTNTH